MVSQRAKWIHLGVLFFFLAAALPGYGSQRHHGKKQAAPVAAPPQTETQPAPPPPPPTLEQQPAVAPQVSYQNGQLTILARNSTLGDILRAVHAQTGASVDVPSNATERVVGSFGPGPARDVLASLLNGSHFDYVMLGASANPGVLERVIITSKSGTLPEPAAVAEAEPQPAAQNPASIPPQEEAQQDQNTDDDLANDAELNDQGDQPDQQDQANQDQQDQIQGEVVNPGVPGQGPKSPEQLLRELQQRQLQQQQQQGTPPGPPQPYPLPPGSQPPQ